MKGPFYLAIGAVGAAALIFTVGACLPDDPYNGVPQCTDAIADAGGICHGEPIPDVNLPTLTLIPCPVEDADNCYWNAALMGNGTGTSFVTIDGITYYPEAGNE